ncbi:protealysin inhibitor emfourin [Microbacterium sp. H1-D42]|uniref:protealysin inhibitor emfourin n=1 Tax=Microbacterium sp. H1-D42 TaxID=2925844 RepID=UPI001F530DD0|nr:protealysin inhibitor emfourin [Microbacterium sp. H1-D42]UNK70648.1 hypothetical protein MNR00_16045 [Microbacterium sp. H1-D42]
MHEREIPGDGTDSRSDAGLNHIVVAVVRTGGLAGMRRRWRAEPDPEQTPHWLALVEQCPWDEPMDADEDDVPSADRYIWSIHARVQDEQRQQVVPDTHMQGAWRELVDAVRDADPAPESR